jgi:hypothetical protein
MWWLVVAVSLFLLLLLEMDTADGFLSWREEEGGFLCPSLAS